MALIICPECGGKISDKASACIHCGFPLSAISDSTNNIEYDLQCITDEIDKLLNGNRRKCLYKVSFKAFRTKREYNKNRTSMRLLTEDLLGRDYPEASVLNCDSYTPLFDGLTKDNACKIQRIMEKNGCIINMLESKTTELSPVNEKIEKIVEAEYDPTILMCPRCKSTAVTTGARGYSLMSGFIGSNRTVNRCGSCGHSWKP